MNKNNEKRLEKNTILSIVLTVLWMSVIFFMSSQPGNDSSQFSRKIATYISDFFYKVFAGHPPKVLISLITEGFMLRKAAHFTEYAILGVLVLTTIRKLKIKYMALISIVICMIYAISDELHQMFVPGRAASVIDVMIDASGAIFAIILCLIFIKIRQKKSCN